MKNINASETVSIAASAGEIYALKYADNYTLDIMNNTGGDLLVAVKNGFTDGNYLTVPAGAAYNNYRYMRVGENAVYIKASAAGNICIAARRV
jgi:hypothetical protein